MSSEPGWLRGFLIFRLPLIAVAGLALKGPLSELYIHLMGNWWHPGLHWAIYSIILYLLSMPARIIALGLFAGVFALLRLAAAWRERRSLPWWLEALVLVPLMTIGWRWAGGMLPEKTGLALALLLFLNMRPLGWYGARLDSPSFGRTVRRLTIFGVGLVDLLCPPLLWSLASRGWDSHRRRLSVGAAQAFAWGLVIPAAMAFALGNSNKMRVRFEPLTDLVYQGRFAKVVIDQGHLMTDSETRAYFSPEVKPIYPGTMYGVVVDGPHQRLFVAQKSLPARMLKFDLADLDKPPEELFSLGMKSELEQIAYVPEEDRIYHLDRRTRRLYRIDPASGEAEVLATLDKSRCSQNARVHFSRRYYVIRCEADGFFVIERDTMRVVHSSVLGSGMEEIAVDQKRRRAYLSYFRHLPFMLVFDLESMKVTGKVPLPAGVGSVLYHEPLDEIYVAVTSRSWVQVIDAATLQHKGRMKGSRGMRGLALDSKRGWLFAASMLTGKIHAFDLKTRAPVAAYSASPWIRMMDVDAEGRRLYFTSHVGGLAVLDY